MALSWLFGGRKSSEPPRSFNVLIYEEDYKELCAWVLKKPNIETGGDLFGLWADKHTAVIQLVLGPGQGCSRTTASFYQDIDYLQRVGSYLTQNEGVCHIGEWHSHHQLGLAQPSGGDERTVWNNMPTYNLKRFVIFIANIQSNKHSYSVDVGCFLFETDEKGNRLDVLRGEFTILQKESPFSGKLSVEKNKGAEEDENKIAIKDLQLKVKEGGKSPSVTYIKRLPSKKPNETSRRFEVVIYEEDYKELCAWVLKKPDIETGGDLFGLWADKHTAVIQLVLGPGQECRRTSTSFYQDIDYLQRVGSYLTQNEGVCHIGEWHSHHQLGLTRPSGGDENTVWNNMPTYNLKKFVIFIANIQSAKQSYNANIGCFLFETDKQGNRLNVLPGEFTILQKENLLSLKKEVFEKRNNGAEKDGENKIPIKDLKLEVKEGRKRRPSVTYLKPLTTSQMKRNREKTYQTQTEAKSNNEESSGDSKKQKMDTETSAPITPTEDAIAGSEKMAPDGLLATKDLKNVTINDAHQDEQHDEGAMEVDEKNEQPENKKEEEEIKPDDVDQKKSKNPNAKNQDDFSDQENGKEKSKEEEKEKEMEVTKEPLPTEGDQGKPEKVVSDKESPSIPQQEPRPVPMMENEVDPGTSPPITPTEKNTIPESGKMSPDLSLTSKDLKNLRDEQPERVMKVDGTQEEPEKKEEEKEIKHDDVDQTKSKNPSAKNQDEFSDQVNGKEKLKEEENEKEMHVTKEPRPTEEDQEKPEKVVSDKEIPSIPRQEPRPVPTMEKEIDPETSPLIAPAKNTIPESGKMSPDRSLISEDLKNVPINATLRGEQPEEATKVNGTQEELEKKEEEKEIKHDDVDKKNSSAENENEFSDQKSEKGKSKGEENEKEVHVTKEPRPTKENQEKPEEVVSDKEIPSIPRQEPRPVQTMEKELAPETSLPITPAENTIQENGKMSPDQSLTNEDLKSLTINVKPPDEQPEEAMKVDGTQEELEKKEEEKEIKHDDVDKKNLSAKNENEFSDQKSEKEKSKEEKNDKEMAKMEVTKETRPPVGDQGKPEKVVSDKESPSIPTLEKETTSAKQTGRQPLQVQGKAATKVGQSSGKEAEKKIETKESTSQGSSETTPKIDEKKGAFKGSSKAIANKGNS